MMNILMTVSAAYSKYAMVCLESLYQNNRDEKITVYIASSDCLDALAPAYQNQAAAYDQTVKFIRLDPAPFDFITNHVLSKDIFWRLCLHEVLPDTVDRILSLDADIIVNKPISDFYHQDFDGCAAVACEIDCRNLRKPFCHIVQRENRHCGLPNPAFRFNSGVILFDINRLRKKAVPVSVIEKAYRDFGGNFDPPEEMLFNIVYGKDTKKENSIKYNLLSDFWDNLDDGFKNTEPGFGSMIHYTMFKPWLYYALGKKTDLDQIWWGYAERTPFAEEIRRYFDSSNYARWKKQDGIFYDLVSVTHWNIISANQFRPIAHFFLEKGLKKIAVYGANFLQVLVCNELSFEPSVKVLYLVDSFSGGTKDGLKINKRCDCRFDDIDAVLVTAVVHHEAIQKELRSVEKPVFYLDDLLEDMLPPDFYLTDF